MDHSLFQGESLCLAALDPDRDAAIESQWTHDPEYHSLLTARPVRPQSVAQIKKKDQPAEQPTEFTFALRARADDRLVGVGRIYRIEWGHRVGMVELGIGSPDDRGHGLGSEALRLLLRYTFDEMHLYHVTAATFEYNLPAQAVLERAGMRLEVRRRQAVHRGGRRWDVMMYGLLLPEWESATSRAPGEIQ